MGDLYKLEKPDFSADDVSAVAKLMAEPPTEEMAFALGKTISPRYLYWDDVRRKPTPGNLTPKQLWLLVKRTRGFGRENIFIKDKTGRKFSWIRLHRFEKFIHDFTMSCGGNLLIPESSVRLPNEIRPEYVKRSIIEEAIASSQLEGAHTTRSQAEKMIREGRKPRGKSEKMIAKNYQTMDKIWSDYRNQPLTEELILEIHHLLTEDTDVDPDAVGKFRTTNDPVTVVREDTDEITHIPPGEDAMRKEMKRFIAHANDDSEETYLHPLIKAVFLHFWIGYLHPFADGNGRFARAIFYWYLLRKGYRMIMYLPISVKIRESKTQYGMAYIKSEQDDNDLTYFLDYNLDKIRMALDDFKNFVKKDQATRNVLEQQLASLPDLNDRQRELVAYFFKNSHNKINIGAYQNRFQVTRITSRRDLYDLEDKGLLESKKCGRKVIFSPTKKLLSLM